MSELVSGSTSWLGWQHHAPKAPLRKIRDHTEGLGCSAALT
jgi:hypothetical protein